MDSNKRSYSDQQPDQSVTPKKRRGAIRDYSRYLANLADSSDFNINKYPMLENPKLPLNVYNVYNRIEGEIEHRVKQGKTRIDAFDSIFLKELPGHLIPEYKRQREQIRKEAQESISTSQPDAPPSPKRRLSSEDGPPAKKVKTTSNLQPDTLSLPHNSNDDGPPADMPSPSTRTDKSKEHNIAEYPQDTASTSQAKRLSSDNTQETLETLHSNTVIRDRTGNAHPDEISFKAGRVNDLPEKAPGVYLTYKDKDIRVYIPFEVLNIRGNKYQPTAQIYKKIKELVPDSSETRDILKTLFKDIREKKKREAFGRWRVNVIETYTISQILGLE